MNELFGLSMTLIMEVLLALLAVCLLAFAGIYVANRTMFRMGIRNIRRRPSQTSLVVAGLMLATVIITAAFTTGDSLDYSVTTTAYDHLQRTDLSLWEFRQTGQVPLDPSQASYAPEETGAQLAEAFKDDPNIEGFIGYQFESLPAMNPRTRLAEPKVFVSGFDGPSIDRFGGIGLAGGGRADLANLKDDEVLVGKRAAAKLDARVGDTIRIFTQQGPTDFRVAAIVKDQRASGALEFGDVSFPSIATHRHRLQEITGHQGQITTIDVVLRGGMRGSLPRTDAAAASLEAFKGDPQAQQAVGMAGLTFNVETIKQDAIRDAQLLGNVFTTVFLVLGLFSIAAGAMLIFTLFVMLAAERRQEMGIARAVGAERKHLVQAFVAEGMVYDLLSGLIGVVIGVVAAFVLVVGGTRLVLGEAGSFFQPHVAPRSLIVSFCLGAVLTFLTVVVSSLRISQLNIVAAVRGQMQSGRARPQKRKTHWPWLVLGVPALIVPPLGLYLVLRKGLGMPWMWIVGPGGLVAAAFFLWLGKATNLSFPFTLGVSLIPLSLGSIARYYNANSRKTWSAVGAALAIYWLSPTDWHTAVFGELKGNMEMFVFSGIMIVLGLTLLIVFNARLLTLLFAPGRRGTPRYRPAGLLAITGGLSAILAVGLGSRADGLGQIFYLVAAVLGIFMLLSIAAVRFPRFAPALKMGVAYPLASRFRTGMTIAMFSLVVFSITVMGIINHSFLQMFSGENGKGGWDVQVWMNRNNPIPDLAAALRAEGSFDPAQIQAVGRTTQGDSDVQEARPAGGDWEKYPVLAGDTSFYEQARMKLEGRAAGYSTDRAVYEALGSGGKFAIIDSAATQDAGFGGNVGGLHVEVTIDQEEFAPFALELHDRATGRSETVTVIGVLSGQIPSNTFFGIYTNEQTYRMVFGAPDYRTAFVRLAPGVDGRTAAKGIKAALLTQGVQAVSMEERIDEMLSASRGFLRIFQAFMGLGLFVGIASLGVIALRSVVERRQQIGMLRAIGYQRGTVALSFILESGFIAMMGILSGVAGAAVLSWNLLSSNYFSSTGGVTFAIPWGEIILYTCLAFVFALLMTWWPSRRAASVPIAAALRYE